MSFKYGLQRVLLIYMGDMGEPEGLLNIASEANQNGLSEGVCFEKKKLDSKEKTPSNS